MALTIKPPEAEMIFGALWFNAKLATDFDNRTVSLEEIDITKIHFPDIADEKKVNNFKDLLTARIESKNIIMSLDRLLASLEEVDNLNELSNQINNDPPTIYFRTKSTILVMIDGEPILKKDAEAKLEYVVNTPFFIVKDPKKDDFYINGGKFWYTSPDILKGWQEIDKVPSSIKSFAKKNAKEQDEEIVEDEITEAPEIIVSTIAAELILVDGEIDYKPIEQTTLLYIANSESDIIMDINTQKHFILLAGRWYASKSLKDGDWKFIEPNQLPAEFKKIPENSDLANVRASIPGTNEAQTALLEQTIPQTATIDRKEAKVEVKYDGDPKFENITGTSIQYAVNTDKTVLLIDKKYYCIENAVWFVAKKATGPWEVSTERPDGVDDIPPESPVYNVKYVYIYDSTPEVVYVGYLPGYNYSYIYGGVVVYGTGYYYNPWYSNYYYPRPVTYGYGVHYSPYGGWGFTVGVSYGWVSWGHHPHGHAYWGPRGYHHGYRHGYNRGYHHGYRAGYAAGRHNSNRNVYRRQNTGVRQTGNVRTSQANRNINNNARPSTKPNNMYSDKSGNVYQRDRSGNYQNKSNNQRPSTGQQPRPSTGQVNNNQKQQLDRSANNRNQRAQNYNRSQQQRSRPAPSRGGGGRRRN
jgi:hypothetical protein